MNKEDISKTVVEKLINEETEKLISLLRNCNISDENIMITLLGIGSHTEYYNVLYNRVNNKKEIIDEKLFKKEVVNILQEIDRNED